MTNKLKSTEDKENGIINKNIAKHNCHIESSPKTNKNQIIQTMSGPAKQGMSSGQRLSTKNLLNLRSLVCVFNGAEF